MAAILFVDDESAIRDMLGMVLKLSGHTPIETADAECARRIVQVQKPDLALVDIMMPGEDGFSLAKDLISSGIPVLFLTARTAVADRVHGLRMGAEDYILKPFEPEELLARIDVILRKTKPVLYDEKGIRIDYQSRTVSENDWPIHQSGSSGNSSIHISTSLAPLIAEAHSRSISAAYSSAVILHSMK